MSDPTPAKHILALDGLRGTALLLVMLDHWSVICAGPWAALPKVHKVIFGLADAGWCGVDLFFVLSGFLITGILLDTRAKPHFFRNFYTRRTLRIFPPYYLFLLVWLLWTPSFILPAEHQTLVGSQAWYWVYLQNWQMSFHGWPSGGVDHLWSLAIEEQFYLVWPLVVLAAGARGTLWISVALVALSPVLRAEILHVAPGAHILLYASTITRLDPLAWGAIIAVAVRSGAQVRKPGLFAIAAGTVALFGLIAIDREWTKIDSGTQVFGFAFLALLFAGVVTFLVSGPSLASRFFALRPLREIGKVSYVGYIVHLPIFLATAAWVAPERLASKVACLGLGIVFTFAAATVSWRFFERPLLDLKNRLAPSLAAK